MTIYSTSTGTGNILFGDGLGSPDFKIARIQYDHSDNTFKFKVNNTTTTTLSDSLFSTTGAISAGGANPSSFDGGANDIMIGAGSGNTGATIYSGTSSIGSLFFADGSGGSAEQEGQIRYSHLNAEMLFYTADSLVFYTQSNRILTKVDLIPADDNLYDLGASGNRWDDIWATNGTIQTSDETQKTEIAESDLGLEFINRLKAKKYKRVGGNRPHYGLLAQQVKIAAGENDFAGYVKDTYKVTEKNEAGEEVETGEEKTVHGLRYDEFIAPMIKAIQELTEKVKTLEKGTT